MQTRNQRVSGHPAFALFRHLSPGFMKHLDEPVVEETAEEAGETGETDTTEIPETGAAPDYNRMGLNQLRELLMAKGVDAPKTWNKIKMIKELKAS